MRTQTKLMSVEAYIQNEWTSERRHEYIHGQLFEMPGEQDINNRIALQIAVLLLQQLPEHFFVYTHDVKVAIPGGKKYYYPDLLATAESETIENRYIKSAPQLVVEVVADSSKRTDYGDKLIDYTAISGLEYYLVAEPHKLLVTLFEQEGADWVQYQFTDAEDIIQLPKLGVALPLKSIYARISLIS